MSSHGGVGNRTKRPNAVQPTSALLMFQKEREQATRRPPALLQHPQLTLPVGITELAGPAGSGKTQIALTLCVDSVMLQKQAVYIFLGQSNPMGRTSHRLKSMLAARVGSSPRSVTDQQVNQEMLPDLNQWLSNIHLLVTQNTDDLMDLLQTRLPQFLQTHSSTNVVVLDGIANLFRAQERGEVPERYHYNQWHARSTALFRLANLCKTLSSTHDVPFLVLNQVTSRIPSEGRADQDHGNERIEPALGLSWSQAINASVLVTRCNTTIIPTSTSIPTQNTSAVCRRSLRCLKSPTLPSNTRVEFYIDQRGTVRIRD